MNPHELEEKIARWAHEQNDIEAVVQVGSRVQRNALVDLWSDWDYQLITSNPRKYYNDRWPSQIGPIWCAHCEKSPRGVTKVSVVLEDGYEVDFMPVAAWQLKLAYFLMQRSWLASKIPLGAQRGIRLLRLVVKPGFRVIKGTAIWSNRMEALKRPWPEAIMNYKEFVFHQSAFWRRATWILKKLARGEFRAALRSYWIDLVEASYGILEEEARLIGKYARPDARYAETWLSEERILQTSIMTAPDRQVLGEALLSQIDLFKSASTRVASMRRFSLPNHSAIEAWLRVECARMLSF